MTDREALLDAAQRLTAGAERCMELMDKLSKSGNNSTASFTMNAGGALTMVSTFVMGLTVGVVILGAIVTINNFGLVSTRIDNLEAYRNVHDGRLNDLETDIKLLKGSKQ